VADVWGAGPAYERFMGRWSRRLAADFVSWLSPEPGRSWLDVGSGTGALAQAVLAAADPAAVAGIDPSAAFVDAARATTGDVRARFEVADAEAIPFPDEAFDLAVTGLVLNFVPSPAAVLAELDRVTRPGGTVAGYVWDYAEGMSMLRHFWDAAVEVEPSAVELDEGSRFSICHPDRLGALWRSGGLADVQVRGLWVPMHFTGFDDYWEPFLGGQGPAGGFVASLAEADRGRLADTLRRRLPTAADGTIRLTARAWAVRGQLPAEPAGR
jgi:SAM-dependent methyltransferase